ncbi:MAG TPA: Gfo/Idh/MocA family oxidoreductase [Verrucomicrobiae bacterium]|nr:Gfo/Idh/MocA family oxidoreductase [Verrucomicrobiae bacterium]
MNSNVTRRDFLKTAGVAAAVAGALPSAWAQADKKITLALVGGAHIHTPGFIDLLKTRNDTRVKYVWDHDAARAEKRAKDLNATVVKDLGQIWSDSEIPAVVIYSETNRHHDLVLAAAKAGKHMFVEKPLGITARESLAMAEAIEKANLLFTTGYFMRTDPKHLFLKDEIAKGHFGKITRARGSNCHSGALEGWFDTEWRWMADPKIAGIGGFGDLGTHKLDILMWMLGDIDAVTADVRTVTGRYPGCDECGEGLIQFKDGVIGTLAAGWVDVEDPVRFLISGTEGHAVVVDNHLYYKSKHIPGSDSKDPFTKLPAAARPPMHQFLDAVAGSKDQPLVKPSEAAARVVAMEALYKGAREKKWVSVKS